MDSLIAKWICGQSTCRNERGYCYILEGVHLKLMTAHLKTWSMDINDGKADLFTASEQLALTLMPTKNNVKHPLRPAADTNAPDAPKSMPSIHPSATPPVLGYPYPFYQYMGAPHYTQLPPPFSHHQQYTMNAPETPRSPVLPTSSPPSEIDPSSDKLAEYITWLIRCNPTLSTQLTQCLEMLREHDIVFSTISDIPDELFERWGIKDGLKLMLRSHQKKWERKKANGRV